MSFLLDTNAISEGRRQVPDRGFVDWLNSQEDEALFISALSIGELRRGLLLLPGGARRAAVESWLVGTLKSFSARTLPVDEAVAVAWAELAANLKSQGHSIGAIDELIAATALAHDLVVVTRNLRHFEPTGCRVLCPWAAA